jgi:hypothetical protein
VARLSPTDFLRAPAAAPALNPSAINFGPVGQTFNNGHSSHRGLRATQICRP